MKRIVCILLMLLVLLSTGITASAQKFSPKDTVDTRIVSEHCIENADGSYSIIIIKEESSKSSKSGTKVQKYFDSDGVLQWTVKAQGTFTYNGITSSCTSASNTVTISNNAWYAHSRNSYTSGNKSISDVVMKKKQLGIVVSTLNVHLELACDKNGNLS